MGLFSKKTNVVHVVNGATQGSVDGGNLTDFHKDRKEEILATLLGRKKSELEENVIGIDNPAIKGRGGRRVSLNELAEATLDQQEALDRRVTAENLAHGAEAPKTDGLPPCLVAKQERAGGLNLFSRKHRGGRIEGE